MLKKKIFPCPFARVWAQLTGRRLSVKSKFSPYNCMCPHLISAACI